MTERIFNEKIYDLIEAWRKDGEYSYISTLHCLLEWHARNMCYPNGDDSIYFPKKYHSKSDINVVLNSLGIKYSYSTIPCYIQVSLSFD